MAVARAFQTDYSAHLGLIHQFARKGWARLVAAHVDIEYEDVFQEMSLTYTKAIKTYDPEKGVSFSAYMGRAIWNEFNRLCDKRIGEQMALGTISVQEITAGSDEGESDFYERYSGEGKSPEDDLMRRQEIVDNLRRLSPTAKFLVARLVDPPQELDAAFAAHQQSLRDAGRSAPSGMGLNFIGQHYQVRHNQLARAIKEIRTVYGV